MTNEAAGNQTHVRPVYFVGGDSTSAGYEQQPRQTHREKKAHATKAPNGCCAKAHNLASTRTGRAWAGLRNLDIVDFAAQFFCDLPRVLVDL